MMQVWADYLDKLKSEKVVPMLKPKPIMDVRAIMVPGYLNHPCLKSIWRSSVSVSKTALQ